MSLPADLAMSDLVLDGEQAIFVARRATSSVWRSAAESIELARREPWVLLGADSRLTGKEAVRLAESAVVAELAVRYTVSEGTILNQAHIAQTIIERLPRLWSQFSEGWVAEQNAAEAARMAGDLPPDCWSLFDAAVTEVAAKLTPRKFKLKALGIRERLHPTTADTRHARAVLDRRVWFEPDRDGMAWLGAYLPADVARSAMTRLDQAAFTLAKVEGETRTVAQLRADELARVLTGDGGGTVSTTISLALTIPLLALLDQSVGGNGTAVLDGVGPIPMDMAKQLAGGATSFVRVFTDPITGTVLNMEGKTRRIAKAMRRWLRHRDKVCTFPGCNRPVMDADIDHTEDVQFGGVTANGNLAHLCRKHHTLKHKTNWRYVQAPAAEPSLGPTWTSPLGFTTASDPPPF